MAERRARKTNVDDFIIDFSKEEAGAGGGIRVKEGTYLFKIVDAKAVTSPDKGTPGLQVDMVFLEGKYAKKKFRENLWATPKAYSRFRTLLEACGKKVPGRVNLVKIANAIKGIELYCELADEKREGYNTRSRVTFEGFMSVDDYEAEDDEDDVDEDDLEEEDEDDTDEEDTDEDDDDEEDEPPAKRKKAAPARAAKTKKKAKRPDDDDDDEDLDDLDLDEL